VSPAGTRLPRWLIAIAIVAAVFAVLPLAGLASRANWAELPSQLASPGARMALGLSLRTAAASTVVCIGLGVPLGFALASLKGATRATLRAVLLAPLVLPPVVSGLGLLYAFGRRGLLGESLAAAGIPVAFTTIAVVLAQSFVAMPFVVVAVEAALAARDGRLEAIAATLGAGRTRILASVTLPGIGVAMAMGAVLAFARSLGEFGATLTFAGSLEGVTRTAPLQIYLARETDPQAAVALGLVLVALAIVIVAAAARPGRKVLA
jgi:molybdate transport system permease protein